MYCFWDFMEKRGSVLLIIGIAILVLLIGIVGAGIYFYNFYVFKTVRICVGDATDSMMPCDVTQDCVDYIVTSGMKFNLSNAPGFVRENFQKVFDEVIYCDESCFVRNVRGVNLETQELEMLSSCEDGEIEFVMEIRGKEALEVWKWTRVSG